MIRSFLDQFIILFGSQLIRPKFHFMLHYCHYIMLYGPLRNLYCLPFKVSTNFSKNLKDVHKILLT